MAGLIPVIPAFKGLTGADPDGSTAELRDFGIAELELPEHGSLTVSELVRIDEFRSPVWPGEDVSRLGQISAESSGK